MNQKAKPVSPRLPKRPRPPRGTPAPAHQATENPLLATGKVVRGGAGAAPAVWEE